MIKQSQICPCNPLSARAEIFLEDVVEAGGSKNLLPMKTFTSVSWSYVVEVDGSWWNSEAKIFDHADLNFSLMKFKKSPWVIACSCTIGLLQVWS